MMQVLRHVTCPVCDAKKDMGKYKVYGGKVGVARIKCMQCNIINTADKWRCSCRFLLQKCKKHIVKAQENAYDKQKKHSSGMIRKVKQTHKTREVGSQKANKKKSEDNGYADAGDTG